jgi:hypothetical protein
MAKKLIKRADGSYSQRGLWDNIRANKGSGKKPTKEMLAQEKKIKKKMAVGGEVKPNPIDPPNYKDRLQQYLSLSPEYRNMFTARSPLEYGLSTDGFDAGMYFNPMTNMPGMYGALNLNKKGFNLGAEKRIGLGENTTDLNAGFSNDKFNVSGNLKRGTQGNEFGFSAGYNTPNLNIGASYSNVGGMPNVNANVGFNKNNFRGGLGYEYSDGNRLTGNVGYSKDAYDVGVSGMYSPTDSNISANLNYKLGTRKKQKTEPINIKSDKEPQEIKLIKDDEVSSGEAAFPNMKNNKIPKLGFGATLAPMLFDVGANALMNLSTKAVTDMIKAIREPEPELRPTKPNTGFTMATGGVVGGDPIKKKRMKSGEYVTDEVVVTAKKPTMYEKRVKAAGKDSKRYRSLGSEIAKPIVDNIPATIDKPDSFIENIFEYYPGIGNALSLDDAYEASRNMFYEGNSNGTFNNILGTVGVVPAGKAGNFFNTNKYLETVGDALGTTSVMKDVYEDNITPMLPQPKAKQIAPQTPMALQQKRMGGMIDPSMYMQQMMYGSYAQGGQVPQNIPVEVEGEEMYEMPNGQVGKFQGPTHEEGGIIPVVNGKKGLPEGTKVYSDRLKVNGKTMADRKDKRERNIAKLEKLLGKTPHDKFLRQSLERQKETAALEEQSDMAMQEQANQKQQMQQQAQQAMMQEQAMAGLMQDPAMMQQMGMMMYGGKLNNGTPPYGLLNYISPTLASNVRKLQDASYNPFTSEQWNTMTNSKPFELPLTENTGEQTFKGGMQGTGRFPDTKQKGKFNFNPELNQNLDFMNDYFDYYNEFMRGGTKVDYNNPDRQYPYVLGFNPSSKENDKLSFRKLNQLENAAKNYGKNRFNTSVPNVNTNSNTSLLKPEVTDIAPPFLTEEQLNQFTNFNTNPLDLRENVGVDVTKPEPLGVNPYNVMNDIVGNTFGNIALSKDPYINTKGGLIPNPLYNEVIGNKMLLEEDPKKPNKFMNFLNKAVDETGDFFSGMFDKNGKPKKDKGAKSGDKPLVNNLDYTRGDLMGMAGTLYGGLGPMMGTMMNRMMTPAEVNTYTEYGAEGLRAMQEAQALAAINRDKQLGDIKLGEEAGRQRGRNSARGVNTLRALDIASDMGANQAQGQAYNSYAQQMMQMLGQKAQMENQQDQVIMSGEERKRERELQNLDNFYTNMVENMTNQATLMQKQGKDMNTAKYNKDVLSLSRYYSKYGIATREGANGLELYDPNTDKKLTPEQAQKVIEEQVKSETAPVVPTTTGTKKEEVKPTTSKKITKTGIPMIDGFQQISDLQAALDKIKKFKFK